MKLLLDNTPTPLTPLQRQVLQVAAIDCPLRRKTFMARLRHLLRTLTGTRSHWIGRPLANPALEALRLFFCLNRRPDPALMTVVRRELSLIFDDRTLDVIAAEASGVHQPKIPRAG